MKCVLFSCVLLSAQRLTKSMLSAVATMTFKRFLTYVTQAYV